LEGKTIAILGLAFKPNTDDMREAPSLDIYRGLVAAGAKLRACDPIAEKEASWRLKDIEGSLRFYLNEYQVMRDSDAVVIVTEWNQFRDLDLDRVKDMLKAPNFFDLRNIYKRADVEAKGFRYFGVGQ
jgi:UDPglucose 6-dehydrogenase